MAMPRSPVDSFGEAVDEIASDSATIDATMLPPG